MMVPLSISILLQPFWEPLPMPAPLAAVGIQRTGAADGQGSVVVGLFYTGVVRAAVQGYSCR